MPETVDIVDCMTAMRGDHQPFAVATVVRTEDATAAKAGARALIDGKARMIRVRPAARSGEDSLPGVEYYVNSCASEGVIELFVEPVLPKPVLLVAGASPTARALADL